jgi:kynurenine formamidase
MDTDTTDKMDSGTYILQHGHYQIEVMANLDKVPPDRFSHRCELAQIAKWSRISGA